MQAYLDLLDDILRTGIPKDDRTGVGTLSVFGRQLRFDLAHGFPLMTTKKLHVPSILYELLWFVSGDTNVRFLREHGVSIWDEWADENGDLGPVYGQQWRAWELPNGGRLDQLARAIDAIKRQPDSRRHLVLAWNPAAVDQMALPPCHYAFQLYVGRGKLSCMFHMRSIDVFLGLPFNIASYALLTHMIADHCGLGAGELIWTGGDTHLYRNHLKQAREQIKRKPYPLPQLRILRTPNDFFDYRFEDFEITNYQAHPHISAPVAV